MEQHVEPMEVVAAHGAALSRAPYVLAVLTSLLLGACGGGPTPAATGEPTTPTAGASTSPATSAAPTGVPELQDGAVTPGRYRFAVLNTCDVDCPADKKPALPTLEVTVPAGWTAATEVVSLFPVEGRDTASPNDPALALGWTNWWVRLSSQPCSQVSHQKTDIPVGPTVDDLVDAVAAHPLIDTTEPRPVKLGRYGGTFFSLLGPKDLSDCHEWRPWEPAPYVQGPANRWDLWVMDVDGVRVVIMTQYFPETPAAITAELRAMAESVRFTPGRSQAEARS
jgi:hypothetical protein